MRRVLLPLLAAPLLLSLGCTSMPGGAADTGTPAVQVSTALVHLPWETSLLKNETPYGVQRYWWEPDTLRPSGLRALEGVWLENEYLRVLVLPELGGVIGRLIHKPSDDDMFYHEGRVKTRGPYWDSGVKTLFPFGGHSIRTHGQPASWRVYRRADGTAVVAMLMEFSRFGVTGVRGFESRYSNLLLSIQVVLEPGRGDVQYVCRLVNPVPWRQGRKVWVGAMFPRTHTPAGMSHGTEPPPAATTELILPARWISGNRTREVYEYEPAMGKVGRSTDEHNILNAWGMHYGFAGAWYPEVQVNRLRIADPDVVHGTRFYFRGERTRDQLKPHNRQIYNLIEVFSSFDTLGHICEDFILPGHAAELSLRYTMTRGIGKVDFANTNVAVNVALTPPNPRVEAVPLRPLSALSAEWNGVALGPARACAPDQPARFALPAGADQGRLVLSDGNDVILDQVFPVPVPDDRSRHEFIRTSYVEKKPQSPAECLAVERYGLGDWNGYFRLLKALPKESVALGRIQLRAGLVDAAVKTLRAALADDDGRGDGHYLYGVALLELGREKEAEAAFAKAVAADRPHAQAHYFLALAHVYHDRNVEAVSALDRLLAAAPGHWEGRLLRAWLLGQQEDTRDEALRELGAMEVRAPADIRVQAALNEVATRAGDDDRARRAANVFRRLVRGPGIWRRVREWRAATHGIYKPPRRLELPARKRK